jgi:hypothetical protein
MVAALRHATGVEPVAATGKPDPTMHREMMVRTGAEHPIVVGDRLDTDIAGAVAAGCPSLLVLTGVTTASSALAASPDERPTYVSADLSGLLDEHPDVTVRGDEATCGRWSARVDGDTMQLVVADGDAGRSGGAPEAGAGPSRSSHSPFSADDLDAWRAVCGAWWATGVAGEVPATVASDDDRGREVLARLGLSDDAVR